MKNFLFILIAISFIVCAGCLSNQCNVLDGDDLESEIDCYLSGDCQNDLLEQIRSYFVMQAKDDIAHFVSSIEQVKYISIKCHLYENGNYVHKNFYCCDKDKISQLKDLFSADMITRNIDESVIGCNIVYVIELFSDDKELEKVQIVGIDSPLANESNVSFGSHHYYASENYYRKVTDIFFADNSLSGDICGISKSESDSSKDVISMKKDLTEKIKKHMKKIAENDIDYVVNGLQRCTHICVYHDQEYTVSKHELQGKKIIDEILRIFSMYDLGLEYEGDIDQVGYYRCEAYNGDKQLCSFSIRSGMDCFMIINGHKYYGGDGVKLYIEDVLGITDGVGW